MKKLMKVIVLTAIIMMGLSGMVTAATTLNTDVTTASTGCKMVGLPGQYIAECQKALDRMNEIRKEACREGVKNPATGKALTMNDYSELKWSSDMEAIARIRAAESAITMDHIRTNGKSCFAIKSNGKTSSCEVLAWNFTKTMTSGIEQWYREKNAWVKKTGGVTGHYEAIIDPTFHYVGLGCFYSTKTRYYNTTAGEFSATKSGLSETMGTSKDDVIQKLEVKTTYYNTYKAAFVTVAEEPAKTTTVDTSETKTASSVNTQSITVDKTKVSVKKGKTATLTVTIAPKTSTQKVTYTSSNKSIATVSSKGVIKGIKKGSATVTVKSGSISKKVTVTVK